jgi:LemA protein
MPAFLLFILFFIYVLLFWAWKFLEESLVAAPFITMLLIILIPVAIWVILVYNSLIKLREKCHSSFANISTEENRKLEIYLKVGLLIKEGSGYEGALHEKIATIRENGSLSASEKINIADQIFARVVSENYPALKAVEIFTKYQDEISATENKIQKAKEKFNLNVEEYNQKVLTFPSNIIAKALKFKAKDYFNES